MLDAATYELTQRLGSALGGAMAQVRDAEATPPATPPPILQLRAGYAESPGWFLIQAAEFDPDPLTVDDLRIRDIYASERLVAALLELMASEQWLIRDGDTYALAPAGRATLDRILGNRARWLAAVDLPPAAEAVRKQFATLIARSLECDDPPGTWCLAHSRRRAPSQDAGHAAELMQYVSDFNAFRDDAHMAAWRTLGVAGYEWEAFALVAAGQAQSAHELAAQLAHRGYSSADYAAALDEVAKRGWLARTGDGFALTTLGEATRDKVERTTNDLFFAPWSGLTVVEARELRDQMETAAAELAAWRPVA